MTLVVGVTGAVWQGKFPLGDKGGEALIAITVAMATAISTYFARRNNHK